jgi:hypothetical protein
MKELVAWANAGFTQAVAAAAFIAVCSWLLNRWRRTSAESKSEINRKAVQMASRGVFFLQHLVIFGYLWTVLHPLLTPDTPPSRTEVFLISFWTFMGIANFVSMVMEPFAERRARQPAGTRTENYSTEPGGPQMSADSLKSNPTAAMPSTTQQTGSGTAAP